MRNYNILFVIFISLLCQNLRSQSGIQGNILLDTSIWQPVIYLSIIPDFDDMNAMSDEMIIEKANIDLTGRFAINTEFLPEGDNLYRIHIAKKNDPPASLIIGGKDENHFFLIVNKHSVIQILDTSRLDLIRDVIVTGYAPNEMLHQIDGTASFLDSTGFNGSYIKTELIKSAIYEKLRFIADTCSNPLVSLYALYKSNFEKNYPVNQQFYKDYLVKWKNEQSSYFAEFKNKIPSSGSLSSLLFILSCITFFLLGILVFKVFLKRPKKDRSIIHELSMQERKIFTLIIEGKSNKEISEILNIGLSTVKSHVSSIYSKLDINSRKDILNMELDKKYKLP